MRTSRDVYHRLVHDEYLGMAEVAVVGFLDRFKGPMEIPVSRFARSDVPMHRVIYFRHAGNFLWHRETRLDLVFQSSDKSKAFSPEAVEHRKRDLKLAMSNRRDLDLEASYSRPAFSGLRRIYIHHFSDQMECWVNSFSSQPATTGLNTAQNNARGIEGMISIATMNVLHDYHLDPALKQLTPYRWAAIVDAVLEAMTHIFVLTEVTKGFAAFLAEDRRLGRTYAISDSTASDFDTLPSTDYGTGQLILVRRDIAVYGVYYACTPQLGEKSLLFLKAKLQSEMSVTLCALHLTSGRSEAVLTCNYSELRKSQVGYVVKTVQKLSDSDDICILAGDFNFKDDEDENLSSCLLEGYVDTGSYSNFISFSPSSNGLAQAGSLTGNSHRLDRIYVRPPSSYVSLKTCEHSPILENAIDFPEANERVRDLLPNGVHASDHFGVKSVISVSWSPNKPSKSINVEWSRSTALAIIPDQKLRSEIDEKWRKNYDPMFKKWPAHINVLYPFVLDSALPEVIEVLKDVLLIRAAGNVPDLSLRLLGVGHFRHRKSSTVYLQPSEEGLTSLQRQLYDVCNKIIDQSLQFVKHGVGNSFTPHLTIAKLPNSTPSFDIGEFSKAVTEQLSKIADLTQEWKVSTLSVLRHIDGKMTVINEIPIGPSGETRLSRTLDLVRALIRQVYRTRTSVSLKLVGSSVLLQDKSCTDVDVVVQIAEQANLHNLSELAEKLRNLLPPGSVIRSITDANCPILHFDLRRSDMYLPVDLLFGDEQFCLRTIRDTDELQQYLQALDDSTQATYREALKRLKKWAHASKLIGKALCLFAGATWSIMLMALIGDHNQKWDDWTKLLMSFFEKFYNFDWTLFYVTIYGTNRRMIKSSRDGCGSPSLAIVSINSSSETNFTSMVSPAVLKSFQASCKYSFDSLNCGTEESWSEHLVNCGTAVEDSFKHFADIIVEVSDLDLAEEVKGWLKRKFISFELISLQENGVHIRPYGILDSIPQLHSEGQKVTTRVICGVDDELTEGSIADQRKVLLDAGMRLKDDFLRWNCHPANSLLSLTLRCGHSPSCSFQTLH